MKRLNIANMPQIDYACNEALNTLCTNLFYCGINIRSILITSRYEKEGKSWIAINVMKTLAGLGKRTVLIDSDLRRSTMAMRYQFLFNPNQRVYALSQYLAGMCPLEEIVYETNIPNACIVPAGIEVPDSLQLLASPRYKEMIDSLYQDFDIILVDTPPAGVIIDTVEIAKHCDGALIVVGYNVGRKQEIGEVAESIAKTGCKVLGAVINSVDFSAFRNRKFYYRASRFSSYYYRDQKADPKDDGSMK